MVALQPIEPLRLPFPLSRVWRPLPGPDSIRCGRPDWLLFACGFELLQTELVHRLQHPKPSFAVLRLLPIQEALVHQRTQRSSTSSARSSPASHTASAASSVQPPAKTESRRKSSRSLLPAGRSSSRWRPAASAGGRQVPRSARQQAQAASEPRRGSPAARAA